MKYILLFFTVVTIGFAQIPPTDITGGYGANYGGVGGKIALGNVLVLGIGTFQNQTLSVAGFRFPLELENMKQDKNIGSSYVSLTYGGVGVKNETYTTYSNSAGFRSYEESKVMKGWNIMSGYVTGGTIVFDLAVGYAFGKETFFEGTSYATDVEFQVFTFDIGIGFRF